MVATSESLGAPAARLAPRWRRLLAHLLSTPIGLRRAFPPAALREIGAAIERAEAGHGGEIVFVAEGSLPWSCLWRHASARRRAGALFAELRVWDTERNNGVLVYVGMADRAVEIVADRGAAARIDAGHWQQICRELAQRCRGGEYRAGAIEAVRAVGALLEANFPLAPGQSRSNELGDRPILR
jgi:hypothetical protein